jgi:hypothetical protein
MHAKNLELSKKIIAVIEYLDSLETLESTEKSKL